LSVDSFAFLLCHFENPLLFLLSNIVVELVYAILKAGLFFFEGFLVLRLIFVVINFFFLGLDFLKVFFGLISHFFLKVCYSGSQFFRQIFHLVFFILVISLKFIP